MRIKFLKLTFALANQLGKLKMADKINTIMIIFFGMQKFFTFKTYTQNREALNELEKLN